MTLRVLIVSEGAHELGRDHVGGALAHLVRRLLPCEAEFEHRKVSSPDVRIHKKHGKGSGNEKRALAWLRFAEKHDFDAMVLVIDEDGYGERPAEIRAAQENPVLSLRRACGVAIRTFDAWMLADQVALGKVIGAVVDQQPDPERLSDPKSICRQFTEQCTAIANLVEFYNAIAQEIDLKILADRCPKGFAPFAGLVRGLA